MIAQEDRDRVLQAMGDRQPVLTAMWGGMFYSLVDYLALACAPTDVGLGRLRASIGVRPTCKTMVLTGERCSGNDIEGGSDNPILLTVAQVMELLAPVSCMRSEARTGREKNALSVIFSGGVTISPQMGEIPGDQLARQFNVLTNKVYSDVVGADSFCLNTGDQGKVLAAIVLARRIERLVFVHVVDHIARFAATITAALKDDIEARNTRIDASIARVRAMVEAGDMDGADGEAAIAKFNADRRVMPELLFVAVGDWNDRDPRRGRDDGGLGITRKREAFGPMQTSEEEMLKDKRLGCEYADRYRAEEDWLRSIGFACAALSPREMLGLALTAA